MFEAVSRESQRGSRKFPDVSWKFQECFKEVFKEVIDIPKMIQRSSNVLRKFHGCFRGISRAFQECSTGDSRKF